jgi:signal peptidase I
MLRKLLNAIGAVMLIVLLALVLPLTVPKLAGFQLYEIQTGSMEPALPVHSVIYVRSCQPDEVQVGDIITFQTESASERVMTHRVAAIDDQAQTFTTKGDANDAVDQTPVPFSNLTGKVVFHIPALGSVAAFLQSGEGIAACVCVFAAVLTLWIIADRLKVKERVP